MHYIGTQQQCEAYNEQVTSAEGYQDTTQTWAEVRQHPDGSPFAIVKHSNYEADDMELVEQLSADWFPQEEEI